ncbi:hypothetical protein ACQZV8_10430 [Magnetococcales bacterium HHB-1]
MIKPAVFFVTGHGTAGDHWFDWLAKALNSHPEILIYFGEAIRQKYFHERSRKERPDPKAFVSFLADMGMSYQAVGDCFSYRAYQLECLDHAFDGRVSFINIVRHPYAWLHFYTRWRCSNMRMPKDQHAALDHEWQVSCHEAFKGLKPYHREDVEVWSSYQGMMILNRMISDQRIGSRNQPLEQIVAAPEQFQKLVSRLTHGTVQFDAMLLSLIYGWLKQPFHLDGEIVDEPMRIRAAWPSWKVDAFDALVKPETLKMFQDWGYLF